MANPTKAGIIGCGQISGTYFETAQRLSDYEIIACADVVPEATKFRADMYDIPRRYTPEQLLEDPDVEIVINLTSPQVHAQVALAALEAGKHVYNEKPLATTLEDARKILELASQKGLRVGCAPDTFLGGGLQTCQKLIEDGVIGKPVGAVAFMMHHGPEMMAHRQRQRIESPTWQSVTKKAPGFYYTPGVGPMFDMGPYYLTALAVLIGPVRRTTGSAQITWPERPLGDPQFKVLTPSYVAGVLDHENGAVTSIITTTDVWPPGLPNIEIYGEIGSLRVPDPNFLGGPVLLRKAGEQEWTEVPLTHGYAGERATGGAGVPFSGWYFTRGLGIADMAKAIREDRPHRASGALAYHVLEVMQGVHDASRENHHIEITSDFIRPKPLPVGLPEGELD